MEIVMGGAVVFLIVLILVFLNYFPWSDYIKCDQSGLKVSMWQLVVMKLRQVPISFLVESYIHAQKGNLSIPLDKLEVHLLSGGNVTNVVDALISASRSNIPLDFNKATAIDLAGRDVCEAVRMCVQPKVLRVNDIHGIAKDGIEVRVFVNITIKANLDTMVGGAGEDTIFARVCENIVSTIGSAKTHSEILNNPSILSQKVLEAGLDNGTSFNIVSIDISDIDVGRNIGASLKEMRAQADKKVAEAKAEGRLAMAKAQLQENRAIEQEAKANLIAAEMKVPLSLAEAFRHGKILGKRKNKKGNINIPAIEAAQRQVIEARERLNSVHQVVETVENHGATHEPLQSANEVLDVKGVEKPSSEISSDVVKPKDVLEGDLHKSDENNSLLKAPVRAEGQLAAADLHKEVPLNPANERSTSVKAAVMHNNQPRPQRRMAPQRHDQVSRPVHNVNNDISSHPQVKNIQPSVAAHQNAQQGKTHRDSKINNVVSHGVPVKPEHISGPAAVDKVTDESLLKEKLPDQTGLNNLSDVTLLNLDNVVKPLNLEDPGKIHSEPVIETKKESSESTDLSPEDEELRKLTQWLDQQPSKS